jgi:ABC-type uncharacterized transport system auxiliary subunit
MGCTNSLFQASDDFNHNAKNTLENNITRRISFSLIIPRQRNPLFASNERPTKKKRDSKDRSIHTIKNEHNNQVATSDTFRASDQTTKEPYTVKRGTIVGTAIERSIQRKPFF